MKRTTWFSAPRFYFETEADARKAATKVVKESNCVVKFGKTNGHHVLHLIRNKQSITLFTLVEWEEHPWNKWNQPKKDKAPTEGIAEAIRNEG